MPVSAQEIKKPGSEQQLEDMAHSAEGACIAEFESLGTPDVGAPGSTYYSNAVLKLRRNLINGKFKTLNCAYSVQTYPESVKEEAPALGKTFLIIGTFSGDAFKVTKLFEPIASNIALVEQVLRARGVGISHDGEAPSDKDDHDVVKPQTVAPSAAGTSVEHAVKAPEIMPPLSSLSEEPTSSTPWSMIVVLVVVAIGLLWFFFKKAKVSGL